jgi:hypothetical protein
MPKTVHETGELKSHFRSRLEAGATWYVPRRDIKTAVEGFYEDIGTVGLESFGTSVNARFPF